MARKLVSLVIILLLVGSSQPVASHAAPQQVVQVYVDGRLVRLDPPAVIVGGRVLVPLRGTFEAMGATVSFLPPRTIVVMKGSRVIELEIGSRIARVNERPVSMDVPPITVAGHTRIPLRFVGEALGSAVHFDRSSRRVEIITSPSEESFPAPPVPEAQPVPAPVPPSPPPEVQPIPEPPIPRPARPTIVFPLPGTSVGNPVAVQGSAPGATSVRVRVTVPVVGIPIGSADASVLPVLGVFSASVSYPSLFRGLPLSITVVALDSAGVESEPVTVVVRQG